MLNVKTPVEIALSNMWAAYWGDETNPEFLARKAEYRALSDQLRKANPLALCADTDPAQWNFFSDFHKDYYGYRPKGEWTAAQVDDAIRCIESYVADHGWPDEK